MPSKTKDLAIVACLSSANLAFRLALAGGPPNVKPAAFLVIVTGIVGGPVVGFVVGWLSMTLSDLASPFGAGLWTIETSACMATVGLIAGLVWFKSQDLNRWELAVGGFLLTVLYDVGTATIDAVLYSYRWVTAVLALYIPFVSGGPSPYPFGLAHELTTSLLLAGPSLIRQIRKAYHRKLT